MGMGRRGHSAPSAAHGALVRHAVAHLHVTQDTCDRLLLMRALSAETPWGPCAGTVVGSLLGGSLADPCREVGSSMPLCGPGKLLDRQPFLLPCAAVGALSSFAAVVRYLALAGA
jgi:hypothetical protein